MEIHENPEIVEVISNYVYRPRTDKRIHVTDLIYCLRRAWYRLKGYTEPMDLRSVVATEIGKFFHTTIQRSNDEENNEVFVERDGIVGSIDMIIDGRPVEIKTTRRRVDISPIWIKQIKSYLAMIDKTEADVVVIDIVDMRIKGYRVKFTKDEIENNWRWVIERKNILLKHLQDNTPPPGPEYSWECRFCRYPCDKRTKQVDLDALSVMGVEK